MTYSGLLATEGTETTEWTGDILNLRITFNSVSSVFSVAIMCNEYNK